MENEYLKQANEFLEQCKATLKITFSHVGTWQQDDKGELREIYNFTLTTPRGSYSSEFHDSIYNYRRKNELLDKIRNAYEYYNPRDVNKMKKEIEELKPDAYSILACLGFNYDMTFEDFCADFGYNTDSITAMKTYFECQKEYNGLRKIFTAEEMEKLNNIQ